MLFGIVLMFLIFQDSQWTMAVRMCANQSASSKDVALNLVPGTDVSGCNCRVKLTKPDNIGSIKPRIIFQTVQFSGCKYKLVISYNNTKSIMSCSNTNQSIFHTINKSDEIKLYLESTNSQDETTIFEVKITSSAPSNKGHVRLDCFLPTVRSTTKSVITTLNILGVPETTSTTVATQRSTTKPVQPQPTSTTVTTTSSSKTGSTRRDDDADGCDDDDVIVGVIGGVIGGVIVGVSILIIMCIVKY